MSHYMSQVFQYRTDKDCNNNITFTWLIELHNILRWVLVNNNLRSPEIIMADQHTRHWRLLSTDHHQKDKALGAY